MPSHFEGLPVVGIEAQTAGLPCIFSDQIDKNSKINEESIFLPIGEENIKNWCESIYNFHTSDREKNCKAVLNSNFNISNSLKIIMELYTRKSNSNQK